MSGKLSSKHSKSGKKKKDVSENPIVEEYGNSDSESEDDKKSKKSKSSKKKHSKKNTSSDDEDEDISEQFKKDVISYIKYDNKYRQLKDLQTELTKKKKKLSEHIIGYMDDVNMHTISITGGKLHRNKSETQSPLKIDMVYETLKKEYGKQKATELMEKIQNKRQLNVRVNLKRVKEHSK
jgi:hypothetical protein